MTTPELLDTLLGDGDATVAVDGRAAAVIDAGCRAATTARPGELASLLGVERRHGVVLAVAFELARRAAAPAWPAELRGPADVAAIARRELAGLRRERLLTIVCDAANRPLRTVVVADGAIDRCPLPVREILNAVLRLDGRAFALAHNHPGGRDEPSAADVVATGAVAGGARAVGVRFLGHVVVSECGWSPVSLPAPPTLG